MAAENGEAWDHFLIAHNNDRQNLIARITCLGCHGILPKLDEILNTLYSNLLNRTWTTEEVLLAPFSLYRSRELNLSEPQSDIHRLDDEQSSKWSASIHKK